jgi:replicative DNA helicase
MLADFEAEAAVLGRTLAEGVSTEAEGLRAEDFAHPAHVLVWGSVLRLHRAKKPVDSLSVADDLKTRGHLADVGGPSALMDLDDKARLVFNLSSRVAVVRDRAQRRAVVAASRRAQEAVHDLNLRPEQVALDGSAALAQLGAAVTATVATFRDAMNDFLDKMHATQAGTFEQYVPSGIGILDELLGGWCRGQLILLGAYPSVGKGAVIGRSCLNIAKRGEVCHLQSMEDPKIWLAKRYVSNASGVPVRRLMERTPLAPYHAEAVQQAVLASHDWADNIIFDDRSRLTDDQIAAAIRQSVVQRGARVAFIDNASEVDLEHAGDRFDLRTGRMVRLFRDVAKDLDIPVVLAVHFKRPKGNVTKEPRFIRPTSDLFKNSGAFEEAGRVALALWLDEQDPRGGVVCTVLKQTEGEKDFDFLMPMRAYAGLVENKGGRKREGDTGYTQNEEAA